MRKDNRLYHRDLSGAEAKAWATSAAFRKAVKGQLTCLALDADADNVLVEIAILGVVQWSSTIGDDDMQEYFDADALELGAIEREILATLAR